MSDIGSMVNCSAFTTYKNALIGPSGGEVVLAGGVKLTVPPNALSDKVELMLGVTFDSKHRPQVGNQFVYYMLRVEPHYLQFYRLMGNC